MALAKKTTTQNISLTKKTREFEIAELASLGTSLRALAPNPKGAWYQRLLGANMRAIKPYTDELAKAAESMQDFQAEIEARKDRSVELKLAEAGAGEILHILKDEFSDLFTKEKEVFAAEKEIGAKKVGVELLHFPHDLDVEFVVLDSEKEKDWGNYVTWLETLRDDPPAE